jgi:polysaccharide export outer membrane protein
VRPIVEVVVYVRVTACILALLSFAQSEGAPSPELRIGSGDLLKLQVYGVPELSRTVRVGDNGSISLPLVGAIPVAGLSTKQAEAEIRQRLAEGGYVKEPFVSVLLEEYGSQGISVLGEVQKPGIYPLLGQQRLYNAISAAGGLTNKAGRSVTITRRETQERSTVSLPSDPSAMPEHNVEIYPGDTVVVSKAGIIYVVGEVTKPGGFIMENNTSITVLQALALAQGAKPTASVGNAKLIRKTDDGPVEIEVPLKAILQAKASDQELQNDDILFIPGSAARTAATRGLETIIRVATGVAIYGR